MAPKVNHHFIQRPLPARSCDLTVIEAVKSSVKFFSTGKMVCLLANYIAMVPQNATTFVEGTHSSLSRIKVEGSVNPFQVDNAFLGPNNYKVHLAFFFSFSFL